MRAEKSEDQAECSTGTDDQECFFRISHNTAGRVEPRARRTPISLVLLCTMYDMTP